MPSDLKALIRLKKQLLLRQGVLYRRVTPSDAKPRLQLILPPSHRNKAIEGCHDQVGHLGQDRVLELLRDHFYWPGIHIDVASYLNSCPRCLRRKSQADQVPLLNIEVNQPLELIHLDYLKIEPSKGNVENVLVITDHFTRYAQAFPSKTQTALATAKLLWNNFILHYGFPEKIITDQGRNFESELIDNLCQVAGVKKLCTSPYHPQTNGQCERFNSTLLNMLGTLTPEQKKDWKNHVSAMVHAYNCTKNTATGFSPYYLLFGREPRLPVDVEFRLQRGNQKGPLSESNYVSQLKRRLKFAHNKAKQVASKQQARHKRLYDRKGRGATLNIGDLVLVKQTAWKGRHKIQDCWEDEEYHVVDQPTPGIPVYVVKSLAGGRPRVLHRNLLLPLQGRLRKEGATKDDSDSEGEASDTPQATCGRPRRATPNKKKDILSLARLPSPEHMTGDEDSSGDEECVILSTPVDNPTSTIEEVQSAMSEPVTILSSDIPSILDQATTEQEPSVPNAEQESESESDSDSSGPIIPRRSARSTKGIPPVHYGQVQIKSTIISDMDKPTRYRQVLYVPCY